MSSKLTKLFQSLSAKKRDRKEESAEIPSTIKNDETDYQDPIPPSMNLDQNVDGFQAPNSIARARRRLTVDGDEAHLDGIGDLDMEIEPAANDIKNNVSFSGMFAGKSQKGYVPYNVRKANQDSMLITQDKDTETLILGVFDGHGEHGHCISDFIYKNFYTYFVSHEKYLTDIKQAAIDALAAAEDDCNKNRCIKTELSGTTAVICIIRGNNLLTLNVGDSRAILASEVNEECIIRELTHDHKPNLPEEKQRIESAGGRVFAVDYDDGYNGPARVWLADQDIPGLAMSRSICDTVAHSVGVCSTPEITEYQLNDDDRVIVMGSDGLWEFIPNEEVIRLIEDCENPEEAVERLCTVAWKRWYDAERVVDDTTIIVVFIGHVEN